MKTIINILKKIDKGFTFLSEKYNDMWKHIFRVIDDLLHL